MGKKGKVGKNRQDKFYHLAKEQGFRSRASFKLVQLNKRYDFLSSAARGVLDLCAAPGGWMQVARKHMPLSAPCIGIDLVPIRQIPGCTGIVGDITKDSTKAELKRALLAAHGASSDEKVDVVLNDGSPNMGKAWLQDAYTQSELTLAALRLATDFLAPGGTFVSKVFRSNDYNSLLFVMNQLFRRVNATKPSASRAESAEIYVMCIDYKAPKAIDPRLLNPKFVFKDMTSDGQDLAAGTAEGSEKPDLFVNTVMREMKKRKRNRGGYADGDLTLFRKVSVFEFCKSERPVALMVESSQFSFNPLDVESDRISKEDAERVVHVLNTMPETTEEIKSSCEDLKVLARREFKLLLKWRSAAREALQSAGLFHVGSAIPGAPSNENGSINAEETERKDDEDDDSESDSSDEEENLDEELKSVKAEMQAKEKRKKRKANKLRSAVQRKIDMKIILPEATNEIGGDVPEGLFTLNTANRASKHGLSVNDVPVENAGAALEGSSDEEKETATPSRLPYKTGDVNQAWDEKDAAIEDDLDRWYKVYLSRKKRDKNGVLLEESKERKRITKRKALKEAYEKRQEVEGKALEDQDQRPKLVVDSDESSTDEDFAEEVKVKERPGQSSQAALWFSQPMFQGVAGLSSDEESEGPPEAMSEASDEKHDGESSEDDSSGDEEMEDFHTAAKKEAERMSREKDKEMEENGEDFEIVPATQPGSVGEESDTDSFHSSDYDTDEKAEMVAIGKRMRRSKAEAADVLDEAYNRYTFDDPVDLPRWFADPDPVYRKRQPPVTKEQVAEMKEYIKSLQAAPTKKEAEAKARKRARAAKKLDAMKAKANSIAEQSDVPASSRMKAIEDLYKQAMKSGKSGKKGKKKVYQVVRPNGKMTVGKNAGKGRRAMRGVKTTLVDKRLKADKRGIAKATARKKKTGSR